MSSDNLNGRKTVYHPAGYGGVALACLTFALLSLAIPIYLFVNKEDVDKVIAFAAISFWFFMIGVFQFIHRNKSKIILDSDRLVFYDFVGYRKETSYRDITRVEVDSSEGCIHIQSEEKLLMKLPTWLRESSQEEFLETLQLKIEAALSKKGDKTAGIGNIGPQEPGKET